MKTSTKLVFFNKQIPTQTITEFFLGGSYTTSYDNSIGRHLCIERDGETYQISSEYEQYVSYEIIQRDGVNYLKSTILPIYDLYSLKQNLEARCSIIKGDALYNTRLGIPIGLPTQDTKLSILNTITSTYGVRTCNIIRNYIQNGRFIMDVKVYSSLGDVTITVGA